MNPVERLSPDKRHQLVAQLNRLGFTLDDAYALKPVGSSSGGGIAAAVVDPHLLGDRTERDPRQALAKATALAMRFAGAELLQAAGVTRAVAYYNGFGDEGWIEECELFGRDEGADNEELLEIVEEWAYAELDAEAPGWEINQGSRGMIVFDLSEREITVEHLRNVVEEHVWTVDL